MAIESSRAPNRGFVLETRNNRVESSEVPIRLDARLTSWFPDELDADDR